MRARAPHVTFLVCLLLVCTAAAARATVAWDTEISCDATPSGADNTSRGFYISNYPGNNLAQVALAYRAFGSSGYRSITLTAHRGTYDGPRIGTPQTATLIVPEDPGSITVVFDFGGAPVAPGDTIAFTHEEQTLDGSPGVHTLFITNTGSCPRVHGTNHTDPPLDTPRASQPNVVITQRHVTTDCIPSPTRLCIDDQPGDHRYRATLFFHTSQADGISGDAQAIPLADNGVVHGGLFWFFGQDNPEVTLKILPACGLNSHHWVYFVAGTNVGYTLTIRDMVTGQQRVYTNDDLHQATPVADANAFGCP